MSNEYTNESDKAAPQIFDDPVGYLAQFDISAELIGETTLPAAA